MPNKGPLDVRKGLRPKQRETVKAHYFGAAVLFAAAAGFLLLVLAINSAVDFSRFAY